jgi:hypothetical protein
LPWTYRIRRGRIFQLYLQHLATDGNGWKVTGVE